MNVYHIGRTYSMWMMWRWSRSYEQEAGEGFVSYFALRNCCKLIMEVESIVHSIQCVNTHWKKTLLTESLSAERRRSVRMQNLKIRKKGQEI